MAGRVVPGFVVPGLLVPGLLPPGFVVPAEMVRCTVPFERAPVVLMASTGMLVGPPVWLRAGTKDTSLILFTPAVPLETLSQ